MIEGHRPTPDALAVAAWIAAQGLHEVRKADLNTGLRHRACGHAARLSQAIAQLEALGALMALPRQPGSKTIRYAVRLERLPPCTTVSGALPAAQPSDYASSAAPQICAAQISDEHDGQASGAVEPQTEESLPAVPADVGALIRFVGAVRGSSAQEIAATSALAAQHTDKVRACLAQLAIAEIERMAATSASAATAADHRPEPSAPAPAAQEPPITMNELMHGSYEVFLRSPAEPNEPGTPLTDKTKAIDGVTPLAASIKTIMDLQPDYYARHGVEAASVLTITDDTDASHVADYLADQIRGKVVVEIGCGTGRLALHLGRWAKHVYCVEANPAWAWSFVETLFKTKPRNVSYLFGSAQEFMGRIRGDIALFLTQSDVPGLRHLAAQFAPVVIDVYGVESGRVWVSHPKKPVGARGAG